MKDPYQVLGIDPHASPAEIKDTYRRLARQHHPDLDPGNVMSESRFKDISAAYDTLSNPRKREDFDANRLGTWGKRRSGAASDKTGAGAKGAFDRFFRQRQSRDGSDGTKASKPKMNGTNITYSITIDFLEAVRGMSRRISMAGGKDLAVNIPPGTEDGQILRLKEQGMSGIGGGAAGDALIEVAVLPHPTLRRSGLDLHSDLSVTLDEAILGSRIEAETIHGTVQVTVPEDSNTGTRLRLKGKGIRTTKDGVAGDHFLNLKVVLPEKTDADFKSFVQKWVRKNPYTIKRTK